MLIACVICKTPFMIIGKSNKKTCTADCSAKYRAARLRNREHQRRCDESDITPEQELAMRKRARKCPMPGCGARMTDKPNRPNSKHADHILPRNMGGTFTHGNVRIICAACNLKRPKDGSDFTGQVTLWAQGPVPISRPHGNTVHAANRKTCRKGLHPWVPANIMIKSGHKSCAACDRASAERRGSYRPPKQCKCGAMFAAPGNQFMCHACIDAAAHKAAELHAQGGLTWKQVAEQVGYGSANGEGARWAAKRIGYVPALAAPVVRTPPQRLCPGCGRQPLAKYARACDGCSAERAWRAVEMRFGQGHTLRHIADEFGFTSITSVTNLMKTVTDIESRMGRTPHDAY